MHSQEGVLFAVVCGATCSSQFGAEAIRLAMTNEAASSSGAPMPPQTVVATDGADMDPPQQASASPMSLLGLLYLDQTTETCQRLTHTLTQESVDLPTGEPWELLIAEDDPTQASAFRLKPDLTEEPGWGGRGLRDLSSGGLDHELCARGAGHLIAEPAPHT